MKATMIDVAGGWRRVTTRSCQFQLEERWVADAATRSLSSRDDVYRPILRECADVAPGWLVLLSSSATQL